METVEMLKKLCVFIM